MYTHIHNTITQHMYMYMLVECHSQLLLKKPFLCKFQITLQLVLEAIAIEADAVIPCSPSAISTAKHLEAFLLKELQAHLALWLTHSFETYIYIGPSVKALSQYRAPYE